MSTTSSARPRRSSNPARARRSPPPPASTPSRAPRDGAARPSRVRGPTRSLRAPRSISKQRATPRSEIDAHAHATYGLPGLRPQRTEPSSWTDDGSACVYRHVNHAGNSLIPERTLERHFDNRRAGSSGPNGEVVNVILLCAWDVVRHIARAVPDLRQKGRIHLRGRPDVPSPRVARENESDGSAFLNIDDLAIVFEVNHRFRRGSGPSAAEPPSAVAFPSEVAPVEL